MAAIGIGTKAIALVALIAFPWLNPFASGPSAGFLPWLVAATCAAMVCLYRLKPQPQTIAQAWLLAASISVIIAILQYFGQSQSLSPWINTTALGEAFANLRQRNQFASLTNIGLIALLWFARCAPALKAPSGVLLVLAGALLGLGNAASSSRTGLLQLGLVALLAGVWGGLRQAGPRRVLLAAVSAYAVASFVLPLLIGLGAGSTGILARLQEAGPICASRLTLWSNVLHLIAQKPWFGWGWGELDFAHFITPYAGARFCEILDNAHNLPLHLAVELGIPFAVAVCCIGLWSIWRARPWREQDATRQMAWGVIAVILLHSLLEYPLWYGPFQMALGLCVWMLVATPTRRPESAQAKAPSEPIKPWSDEKNSAKAVTVVQLFAIIIIAIVVYAAWDYHRVSQIYLAPPQRSPAYQTNTLAKIQPSWLFKNQVQFAELTTTPVTAQNADRLHSMAQSLMHFSPEARVVQKLIDSALLLGLGDDAARYTERFSAVYPKEHAAWLAAKSSATLPGN